MTVLVANNAAATLAGSYSAAALALTVTSGQGALFPAPTGSDYFLATLVDNANHIEIIKCTSRTADTLTVVRGQEGTTARAYNAGDKLEMRITAGLIAAIRDQQIDESRLADGAVTKDKIALNSIYTGHINPGNVLTDDLGDAQVTSAKLAAGAAAANIGFTPLEQGGGAGQTTDKVHIGMTGAGKLGVQVNATDEGYILTEQASADPASAGYRGVPQNIKNANYSFALTDVGGHVYHSSGATHDWTVLAHASVAFGIGVPILLIVDLGTINVLAAAGVTLRWAGTALTGTRILSAGAMATLIQVETDKWYISGPGVS